MVKRKGFFGQPGWSSGRLPQLISGEMAVAAAKKIFGMKLNLNNLNYMELHGTTIFITSNSQLLITLGLKHSLCNFPLVWILKMRYWKDSTLIQTSVAVTHAESMYVIYILYIYIYSYMKGCFYWWIVGKYAIVLWIHQKLNGTLPTDP